MSPQLRVHPSGTWAISDPALGLDWTGPGAQPGQWVSRAAAGVVPGWTEAVILLPGLPGQARLAEAMWPPLRGQLLGSRDWRLTAAGEVLARLAEQATVVAR